MRKATLIKFLSVSVTEDMMKLLKGLADTDNISVGQLVRTALDYALEYGEEWRKPKWKEGNCFKFNPADFDDTKASTTDSEIKE